jgi:hypothetical protein
MIYDAIPHASSDLSSPSKCGLGATARDRQLWAVNMLKQMEPLTNVENPYTSQEGAAEYMDTADHDTTGQHDTGRNNK